MKEWKKPLVKVVILDEQDLVTSSSPKFGGVAGESVERGRSVIWQKQ